MTRTLELSGKSAKVTLVDDEDYEMLSAFQWYYVPSPTKSHAGYVHRKEGHTTLYMHRTIMLPDPDQEVDHINGNGLDNRRDNLRCLTHQQNSHNNRGRSRKTSRYKGVSRDRSRDKWFACITIDYKTKGLGRYASEEEAARAYDAAAREAFGDYALTNF